MSRAQLIKKIIGEAIQESGFEYMGYTRDEFVSDYSFKRTNGDLIHYISIAIIDDEIRLEFSTNAYGQDEVYASDMIESDFEGDNEGLVFEDDKELEQILYHFKDIILKKGFDVLDSISKPTTEERPTREAAWKLYQEHDALNEEYRKKYGLEETDTTKLIQKISDIILENKDKQFKEVEELLIGLAAVYANQLISRCGGEWEWRDDFGSCMVVHIHKDQGENPLLTVFWYWKEGEEDFDCFLGNFKKNYVGKVY